MCVAVPGKVVEVNDFTGKVDFQGNIIDVNMALVDAQAGDYVLVHAGCAIEVIQKDTADEILELFVELESLKYES
ncbi:MULTISPECIES: HypC/HybG/HupF family hydrogenase formation chaperone [unclassified Dehalobacter]|uniref:HypC/HybG/HupF family hydrogenase formation chaperone n=1 Tax=unclassified Dehalobacter TaxID=2635733 RepID=UPI0003A615EE|nr:MULTISPECIES: HypC/HybG/HupF family hydrogenase formation chaperone [unclassified Dehalobacter]RJE46701.1 hydrogenase assembly protein HypC [Dehalobacter sp. MCB1]TCX49338.1 HypC/HybG/HupF family hydrogenase formation chaperone [Dehalobacter sp. 14DCB1]TCX49918.1 HypC/HybG/HupF family hydrogenase formation chaperone [Dehalobacter sp. 12DCB1]